MKWTYYFISLLCGKLALFLLTLVFCTSLDAQSIWDIKNPSPPYDEYRDVHFVNDTLGWAVGEEGHVIRTDNGSVQWSSVGPVLEGIYYAVHFTSENTGWVAGNGIYKTQDGGQTWEYQFGNGIESFGSLYFLDELMGYAGTYGGEIYKTTQGGSEWEKVHDGSSWIRELYFFDETIGWAMSRHKMMITHDGGVNWEDRMVTSTPNLFGDYNSFQFYDEYNGWVVTKDNYIFRTMDGGMYWDTLPGPTGAWGSNGLTALHFFDVQHGLFFSEYECFITADGGVSFEEAGGDNLYARAVHFPNDSFGCTVGQRQQYTNDSGNNWTRTDIGHMHQQLAVCAAPDNQVFTGGDMGKIMYSDDNGNSWLQQLSPNGNTIHDIFYIGDGVVWACAQNGKIIYSVNNGTDWLLSGVSSSTDFEAISFGTQEKGMCVGNYGAIYITNDGGETWNENQVPTPVNLNDVFLLDESHAWACGTDGYIAKTTDGGLSWSDLFIEDDFELFSICFVSPERGWASSKGILYSTFDGGENWIVELSNIPNFWNDDIYKVEFQDDMNGWAVGEDGLMIHTTNGGTNWVVHERQVLDNLYDISFQGFDLGFAVGDQGYVLSTGQGTYLAPKIENQPVDTSVCEGKYHLFECETIGDSLNFQWLSAGIELPGQTNAQLIFDSISPLQGGLYACKIYNGAGTIYSEDFMVSVIPSATITASPEDRQAHENDTVVFNQAVQGGLPLLYQWQKDGEDLSGANQHIFTIFGVQLNDSGSYRCIVSNSCTSDTTDLALLTVLSAASVEEKGLNPRLLCYPNPCSHLLQVQFPGNNQDAAIKVFSLQGIEQNVNKTKNQQGWTLGLDKLYPGVYYVLVRTINEQYVSSIIKMNSE